MADAPQQICILGGGFGGLYTALRLSQLPWEGTPPTITLVDHRDRFLFLPLLYELVTDELNVGSRAVALRCGFQLEGVLHNNAQAPDGQLRNTCLYAKLPAAA